MTTIVRSPTPLRPVSLGHTEGCATAATVADLVDELSHFINWRVDEEDIRCLAGKATPAKDGDQVSIVPAIAEGASRWADNRR